MAGKAKFKFRAEELPREQQKGPHKNVAGEVEEKEREGPGLSTCVWGSVYITVTAGSVPVHFGWTRRASLVPDYDPTA